MIQAVIRLKLEYRVVSIIAEGSASTAFKV